MRPQIPEVADSDLSLRERAIIDLASGKAPRLVARTLDVTEQSVREVAESFGWPSSLARLKSAATAIRSGDVSHEGGLLRVSIARSILDDRSVDGVPDDLDGIVDRQDIAEPAPVVPPSLGLRGEHGPEAPLPAEAAAVYRDALAPAHELATLRAPLGRLVDADGTEIVLGWLYVEVTIDVPGALEFLGGDEDAAAVSYRVAREFTEQGKAAIRALHGALPPEGA